MSNRRYQSGAEWLARAGRITFSRRHIGCADMLLWSMIGAAILATALNYVLGGGG